MKTCHTPYGSEGEEEETGLYLYGTEEKRNGRWEGGVSISNRKKEDARWGWGKRKPYIEQKKKKKGRRTILILNRRRNIRRRRKGGRRGTYTLESEDRKEENEEAICTNQKKTGRRNSGKINTGIRRTIRRRWEEE